MLDNNLLFYAALVIELFIYLFLCVLKAKASWRVKKV